MIIYKITNIINGKCYIGQTTKTLNIRISKHLKCTFNENRKTYLYNSIRKYG